MAIRFFVNDISLKLGDRRNLKKQIALIFKLEGSTLSSLTYIFCSDAYLLAINQQFLHHEDYTDIITFCLSDPGKPIIGEIYISVERVKENGNKYNVPYNLELHRVIFHGALHLCGYTDKTKKEKQRMNLAEDRYLRSYFG